MVKKKIGLIMFVFAVIAFISFINADLTISQVKNAYSLGEELALEISVSGTTGYLTVNLNCEETSTTLYKNIPEGANVLIKRQLVPEYIGNLMGNCYISAEQNNIMQRTSTFTISKDIIITLDLTNVNVIAGETLKLTGRAIKKSENSVSGFVEAEINGEIIKAEVREGSFSLDYPISKSLGAGNYAVNLNIYEKYNEVITNSGKTSFSIAVSQLPSRIEIALDKPEILPGEKIICIPFLYDFASNQFQGQVLLQIKDPLNKIVYEGYVDANREFEIKTVQDYLPGETRIIVQRDNLTSESMFRVNEARRINVSFMGNIVFIKNSGNVPYEGTIEIIVGDKSYFKEIKLGINGNHSYELNAPQGTYSVVVKDSSDSFNGNVALTGNAIRVREPGQTVWDTITKDYPIVWLFLAIVIILLGWIGYKKYEEKRKFGHPPANPIQADYIKKRAGVEIVDPEIRRNKIDESVLSTEIRKAEQVLTLHGRSQQAGVICIRLKNQLYGIARENLMKSLEAAYDKKGVSSYSGDQIIILFAPIMTKQAKNEETAIKVALEIDSRLKDHNRKFRNDLIRYGIGVSAGEIIFNLDGKILQFACINKTLNFVKKIANIANDEVILSKEVHEKTAANIKVDKVASSNLDLFSVKRVVNPEQNKQFINEFLKRN